MPKTFADATTADNAFDQSAYLGQCIAEYDTQIAALPAGDQKTAAIVVAAALREGKQRLDAGEAT